MTPLAYLFDLLIYTLKKCKMTSSLALQQVICCKRSVITSFWARFIEKHSSKPFQTGSPNFSKISPTVNRCKSKTLEVAKDYRVIQQLKEDLNERLKELNIILKESEEIRTLSEEKKSA